MPPWDRYQQPTQGAPAQPAPQAPAPQRQVGGTRVLGGVPASEQRAQQDQVMQQEAAARAAEAADRAAANSANANDIARQRLDITQRAEERTAANDQRGSESERTAGFLATRIVQAVDRLATPIGQDSTAERPSLGVEAVRGVFGDTAANYASDPERQQVRAAQIDIIDAALTLGTGAAYTTEQLNGYREAYFPSLGDSPATVASKRAALRSLLVAAQIKAGRAAPDITRAIESLDALDSQPEPEAGSNNSATTTEASAASPTGYFSGEGPNYTPENPPPGEVFLGYSTGPSGEQVPQFGPDPEIARNADRIEATTGEYGASNLARQGMALGLADESAGVGNVIFGALTGDFDIAGNYTEGRDTERVLFDRARERTGALGTAAELAGGSGAIRVAPGALMAAGRMAAARNGGTVSREGMRGALTYQATRDGAVTGGIGGFGYGEGFQGSTSNALVGATLGGAVGYGAQRTGNALAARSANRTTANPAQQTQQAADDLGVSLVPAMTGGPTTRAISAGAQQGFVSRAPIANAVDQMQGQAGAARSAIAERTGRVVDADDAGEIVRQAANTFSRRTGEIGSRLYDRAARMAGEAEVSLPSAVQRVDDALAELGQAPGGAESTLFRDLTKLRTQMGEGSFKPSGVRQMRTMLREQMQERGLRGSNSDRIYGEIAAAAENDMIAGLEEAGKEGAARAYRTAADFWRERVTTIDEVLEPVLGKNAPRSGEQILSSLERLARPDSGNASRLRRVMQAMPKEESASVRATVINRLGRPSKGAGEVLDENSFSLERFLTQWNDMSPRARSIMFPPESVQSLSQLATLGTAAKRAGSSLNTSNTTNAVGVQAAISAAPLLFLEPLTVAGITGAQYSVGRLLASPRFARWLAGAPTDPRALRPYMARLGEVAKAEPFLAGDIAAYTRAINDNGALVPTNVAADEQPENAR